jgi:hypothetical protein
LIARIKTALPALISSVLHRNVTHQAYLREQGCYETLTALSLETNASIGKLGKDMLYLQKIVLQGRWSVVEQYIEEVKSDLGPDVIIKV